MTAKRINITKKPWGYEQILSQNDKYVIKRIAIFRGKRLSLQYHEKKQETMYINSGTGIIQVGDIEQKFGHEDIFEIEPDVIHRITAITYTEILEVSTPELDDIIRIEDDYGRA